MLGSKSKENGVIGEGLTTAGISPLAEQNQTYQRRIHQGH